MKKLLNILKRKKGMTLVELVAGMLIFTAVATSATAILAPMLNAYVRANELAEVNTLLDNLSGEMLGDFARATVVSVESGGDITIATNSDSVTYYVDGDGVLCRRDNSSADAPVLEKRYYKGKSVEIEPLDRGEDQIANGNITDPFYVQITISSDKDNYVIASRKYAVNPLGFKNYTP